MKEFSNKNNVFWDFDGVIIDSMSVREKGFRATLSNFPKDEVEELITYHNRNGGLSRYVKFRYFFERIRKEKVTEDVIRGLAARFSDIMKKELSSTGMLIQEVLDFIKKNYTKFRMHIISGSDEEELKYLCGQLEIAKYFYSIHGSPTPKDDLVKHVLEKNEYNLKKTCLIGDSINDYEAAVSNGIDFYGYNNLSLKEKGSAYIKSFR